MTRLNTDYFDIPEHPPSRSEPNRAYRPSPRRCPFCGHSVSAVATIPGDPRAHAIARPGGGAGSRFPK
jgi:hypothetical protein